MSKFDFMPFELDGIAEHFVVHAKKFTKEQAITLCEQEFWDMTALSLEDVREGYAAYRCGLGMGLEHGYTLVDKGSRGAFPVWVIDLGMLDKRC